MCFKKKLGLYSLISILFFVNFLMGDKLIVEGSHTQDITEEEAQENLELPDIYENTIIYNGTINPEFSLWIELPDYESSDEAGEDPEGQETPYVNDKGQFSVTFATEDLQPGDEIVFAFNAPEKETYRQTVEVLPAEEGMEIVESSADTSDVQDTVIEETEIDWLDDNKTPAFEMNTVGDVDHLPLYSIAEEPLNKENLIEYLDQNLYKANFTEDQLNIGETVTVYIVASGVTTTIETEVPETLSSLQNDEEQEETNDTEENEGSDEEVEDLEEGSDIEDDKDETDASETEEGISAGWIIAGVVLILAVSGGIVYVVQKRGQ